jgi:hypothetical protein
MRQELKLDCAAVIISNQSRPRVTSLRLGNYWHQGHASDLGFTFGGFQKRQLSNYRLRSCCRVRFPVPATFCHLTNTDKGDTCSLASIFGYRHLQLCQIHLRTTSIGPIRSLHTFRFEILLKSKPSRLIKAHVELRHLRHSMIEFAKLFCNKIARVAPV